MRNDQYFILEVNFMNDDKVAAMMLEPNPGELFGVYVALLLHLRTKDDYMGLCDPVAVKVIARRHGFGEDTVNRVIREFGLFEVDGRALTYRSPYLDKVMRRFEEKRKRNVENGKKGGRPRKHEKNAETPAGKGRKPNENQKSIEEKSISITPVEYNSSNTKEHGCGRNAVVAVSVTADEERGQRPPRPVVPWEELVDGLPAHQYYMEQVAMHSGLGKFFVDHQKRILELFKAHARLYSKEGELLYIEDVKRYFSNYVMAGSKTCRRLYETLVSEDTAERRSDLNRFEEIIDGRRSYLGHSIPDDAPPRPDALSVWDNTNREWGH